MRKNGAVLHFLVVMTVPCCLLGLLPTLALGQRVRHEAEILPPAQALALLASGEHGNVDRAAASITAAFAPIRVSPDGDAVWVGNYDRYTTAQRQVLLDGLERIARGDIPGEEVEIARARTRAFAILRNIAHNPSWTAPESEEIPQRLIRIYRQSKSLSSKGMAILMLGEILPTTPSDAPEVIGVLVEAATSPSEDGDALAWAAVRALKSACEVGIPVLRRLREQRLVPDRGIALHLEKYAEMDYPLQEGTCE